MNQNANIPNDVINEMRFKAQLLKTYILGMFPKNFCKIKTADNLDAKWGSRYLLLRVKYLNKLMDEDYRITVGNKDTDLDEYVSDNGLKVKDITALANYRNKVVKAISVPSKLSMRSYKDELTVTHKDIKMMILPRSVTITHVLPRMMSKQIDVYSFRSDVNFKLTLSDRLVITNEELSKITEQVKKLSGITDIIRKKITENKIALRQLYTETVNNAKVETKETKKDDFSF